MAFPIQERSKQSAIVYPKIGVSDVLRLFWKMMKRHWLSVSVVVVGISIGNAIQIAVPIYYKRFFDLISSGRNPSDAAPELVHVLLIIFALNGILWIAFRTNDFTYIPFVAKVMARLRMTAFNYLIGHSYSFFSNSFTGGLTQRVNRLARAFENLADRFVFDIIPIFIKIVGVTIVLWFVNHAIMYLLIVWLFVFLMVNYLIAKWKLKYDIRAAELDSKLTGTLADAITNHNSVQLFNGYERESKKFFGVNEEWRKLTAFRWDIDNIVTAFQLGMIVTIEFLIFYFGIRFWTAGIIGVGAFVLFQTYFVSITERLWGFGRIIRNLYEGFADAKEMVQIMKLGHEIQDVPKAQPLKVEKAEIDFKNVLFAFNKTRTVLNGVSLHIKQGEKVGLVGPSGAGKSTFVRLLLRLYDIHGGEISIDGQNIARVTQNSLRENISLVPQDPVLFHRTLMDNIRYGKADATDEEVIRAAKLAHCDEFIDALPAKYETYVGERGIKLSGGERQRVAIARAILKNAPILILDEATSSLDSHSESLIQDALNTLMKGKTTIVIAHRLSTIQKMDRIVVFKDGSIVEEGPHESLLRLKGGLYAKLWSLQAGGFLKEPGEEDKAEPVEEEGEE
jgi:ATP-binding cassette subfamily B protein